MRASQFFIKTLKEAPADAEIPSQIYSARAGLIKKLAAGVFTFMPMGMRVMRKISAIIREEMDRAGAIELSMPIVQPAELWQESGRWAKYGPELLRFKDRHQRDFVISPQAKKSSPIWHVRKSRAGVSFPSTSIKFARSSATNAVRASA